ncbi:MAG TPA: protein kinase [Roseiflexaceae bacterium]|nr:protein kinase [Roseiflexaceae bacterium]
MIHVELLAPGAVLRGQIAEYRILALIGRGGMGAVYRALRLADGTIWALKEMRPQDELPAPELEENRRLFLQEAELLRQLSHPALPVVADLFDHQGRPVLVMEFVPGSTLEDTMHAANAPLLEQTAINYGIQIARVLHYLHTRQPPIIYRDLKPSNIMATPEGVLKLIDFGVARTHKKHQKKDTVAMGSAGYAPAEQYGKGQTDARSDVYALGATLLHLLTNLPPIPLHTPTEGSIRSLNPSVDPATEQVIIRAMHQVPEQRYTDAQTMEQALRQRLNSTYVDPIARATPPPPSVPASAPPSIETRRQPPPPPQPVAVPVVTQPPAAQNGAGGPACANCGRVNKPAARFCAGCGAPLSAASVAPHLKIVSPRGAWEQVIDRVPLRIGRRDPRRQHYPELDLAEHDRGIASRNHAMINRSGDRFTLTDLGSTNGTQLNGNTIPANQPQRLRSGDRIKIGEVEIEFRWT